MTIHKTLQLDKNQTKCGLISKGPGAGMGRRVYIFEKQRTDDWKIVTCKNCLKAGYRI